MFMTFAEFEHAAVPTPKQQRSEEKLQRMLEAARTLLEDSSFEELSVQKVARHAGCSVGTFYARFADKDALLDSLDELYTRDLIREFEELASRWSESAFTLSEKVHQAAAFLVEFHRQRRGVVRALILQARLRPGGRFGERTKRMVSFTPGIVRSMLEHAGELGHSNAKRAARFGLIQALTTVREFVLFSEGPASAQPLSDKALVREVARSWYVYLTSEERSL